MFDYQSHIKDVIADLAVICANGEDLDLKRIVKRLDPGEDNSLLVAFCAKNGIKKRDFAKALAEKAVADRRIAAVGGNPRNANEFVVLYLRQRGISSQFSGALEYSRTMQMYLDGKLVAVTDEDLSDPDVRARHKATQAVIKKSTDQTLRDIRIAARDLDYRFHDGEIADAFQAWRDDQINDCLIQAIEDTRYVETPGADEAYRRLAEAAFEGDVDLNAAILKKFWWQTKRKMRDLKVTNHLMPVIMGPQEVGKSYFVDKFIAPLKHLSKRVNFDLVTDGKSQDIWRRYIHVFDEMAFASRADGDKIKEIITAEYISMRTLYTNTAEYIKQNATSIGTSNMSLAELITDTTGNRRFAPMQFRDAGPRRA